MDDHLLKHKRQIEAAAKPVPGYFEGLIQNLHNDNIALAKALQEDWQDLESKLGVRAINVVSQLLTTNQQTIVYLKGKLGIK